MNILLTGTRAPATLDLARRLWREGHRVIGADSLKHPLGSFSKAFAVHHRIPPARFEGADFEKAILRIVGEEKVDLLWPTCEEIFAIASRHAEFSRHTRVMADPITVLEPLHHKLKFARLAGSAAPDSWPGNEAPTDRELVWKPFYSRFAVRTRLGMPPRDRSGWMAQEFIEGEEFSSWALCQGGEVRTLTFYECPARAGRGAGCAFDPIWDESAAGFVIETARRLNFTGSLAFDFFRDHCGRFRVIECNPRLTSGIHVLDKSGSITGLLERATTLPPEMVPAQLRLPTLLSRPLVAWTSPDVIGTPDDPGPRAGQVRSFVEFAGIALKYRISLTAATTFDLEYNGDGIH
jgi:hypothetical protein